MAYAEAAYITLVFGIVGFSLWYIWWLLKWLMAKEEGTDAMKAVSTAIREGADSFLNVQYRTVSMFAAGFAVVIFLVYLGLRGGASSDVPLGRFSMASITAVAFVLGATCSGLSGWCGMWVSVRCNVRATAAAVHSADDAIKTCLRGGAFSGMIIVSLSLFGVTTMYTLVRLCFPWVPMVKAPLVIVGYGFGASFVALFAQLGGGIYTKAADVGADLVGKVESGIPEDDPRNPAVVADLVGDNVGDCAGRGADLFESTAAENIGAMILGASVVMTCPSIDSPASFILFPLVCRACGLIATMIGVLYVHAKKTDPKPADRQTLMESAASDDEDPIASLNRGYFLTLALSCVFVVVVARIALHSSAHPECWWHFALCGIIGIALSFAFVFITEYYTDCDHRPVMSIASASTQGHATNIIAGLSVGMESTGLPTICIAAALLCSFWLGSTTGLEDTKTSGIYGTAVATMGMLISVGFVLAMDTFGPISDNAGGIAEFSGCDPEVRNRVDRLDAVGNTTKALTKGYAVGSAALASFLLFSAFLDNIQAYTGDSSIKIIDLSVPEIFVGGLIGVALVFFFSSMAIQAVGRTAQLIVIEVRRQFKEKPGILLGTEKPEYGTCVAIVTRGALKEMVLPCLLVLGVPIGTGLFFRVVGMVSARPNLGAQALASLLMCATIGGILVGLFLNNAGGAWDNAKKLIETGAGGFGGKKSEAHKAAVTGDTVGDPCKDTAGPSLHVLVKLLSTITLVLYPIFASGAATAVASIVMSPVEAAVAVEEPVVPVAEPVAVVEPAPVMN
ncbi:sodium-translocating pyrophosphatase [Pelomyxa schiedti]|nr:sodium-translocating pyrophosphatase [Pelomyxa schiedti]